LALFGFVIFSFVLNRFILKVKIYISFRKTFITVMCYQPYCRFITLKFIKLWDEVDVKPTLIEVVDLCLIQQKISLRTWLRRFVRSPWNVCKAQNYFERFSWSTDQHQSFWLIRRNETLILLMIILESSSSVAKYPPPNRKVGVRSLSELPLRPLGKSVDLNRPGKKQNSSACRQFPSQKLPKINVSDVLFVDD